MTHTPLAAEAIVGHDQTACQGRPNWMSGLSKPAHGGWSFSLTGDGAVVAVTAAVVPPLLKLPSTWIQWIWIYHLSALYYRTMSYDY